MKIKGKIIFIGVIIFIAINILVFLLINKDKLFKEEIIEESLTDERIDVLMIEPDHFISLVSNNKYVHEVCNLVFEGLTKIDNNLKAEPQLAKLILTSDNLKWDITLRDDVYFHNGNKFTADDVVFTINKIKELGNDSYFSYNVQNIKNVKIISDYELFIELNDYDNFFLNKLTFPILSKDYYSSLDLFTEDKYIGTGPYKVVSKNDEQIELVHNEMYYLETLGNIKNIGVKIIAKTRPGFDLLKLGEIDVADTNTEVGAYGRSAYDNSRYITNVFEGITFNPNNEVLKDNILRQAILLGINRDQIIEKELHGYGVYADIPVNLDSYLYNSELKKYAFNPERAQDLLTNSGWTEKNTIREKEGVKLEFNLLINYKNESILRRAEYIKNDLSNVGIKINIIPKKTEDYAYSINTNDYDLAITDWAITNYPEFLYNFESNSENNVFGFKNQDYDYLVYLAKREILEGKQKEHFNEMQKILFDELPMIGLYFETSTVFYNKRIDEKLVPQINNIYNGIANVIINSESK